MRRQQCVGACSHVVLLVAAAALTFGRCVMADEGSDETCADAAKPCNGAGADEGSCCPTGSWPALAEPLDYVPQGTVDKLGDMPIYYVGQPGPKAVIVLPEVFGWAGRLKGICDTLAAEGLFVVMPDCHRGETAEGRASVPSWLARRPWLSRKRPDKNGLENDFARIRAWLEERGAERIGAVGFCWGAWALSKASAAGMPFACGVGVHPSTQLERVAFADDELAMMSAVSMPLLLLPAGNDSPDVKTGGAVAEAIAKLGGASHEYPEMVHGWVTRGDVSEPAIKRDVQDAVSRIIGYLRSHL